MTMITPMVPPIPPGWTARPIPARMRTATRMIMGMDTATITAMAAIRMNTMPT